MTHLESDARKHERLNDPGRFEKPKGPPLAVRVSAGELGRFLADAGFVGIELHEVLPWHPLVTARRP